ncbi:MAG: DUF4203 domain-containing protein [Thermomicrobiales bacterium]|nr:DUF4203 domain-containing protein [Thermomicrobiales bacterium]
MQEVLLGIVILVLGLGICFYGLQAFFVMLPIFGAIGGFFVGSVGIAALLGEGFLATVVGFAAGIIVGLLFAVLSYFWWYFGVLLSAGIVGAGLGTGLMSAIGLTAGWWLWIVAVVVGVVFALIALALNLPVYLIIVETALGGAAAAVSGLLLLLHRITFADLGFGPTWAAVRLEWFWTVIWIVVAVLGMLYQLRTIDRMRGVVPEERWVRAQAV